MMAEGIPFELRLAHANGNLDRHLRAAKDCTTDRIHEAQNFAVADSAMGSHFDDDAFEGLPVRIEEICTNMSTRAANMQMLQSGEEGNLNSLPVVAVLSGKKITAMAFIRCLHVLL